MKKITLVSLSNAMGMQLYCTQLANTLCESYDISIIVTKHFDDKLIDSRVTVYKYFTTKKPTIDIGLLNISSYYKTNKILSESDAIHILNSHPSIFVLELFNKKRNIIFSLHDPIPHTNNMMGKCRALIDRIIVKYSTKIIIHSKMHYDTALVKKYAYKTFMTPLASKKSNSHYLPLKNNNTFLFFGRIEEYKGLDLLIAAFEKLADKEFDFKCVIAGNGDFKNYSNLIRHPEYFEVNNRLIPEEEVQQLFEKCTFCIMTYKTASQSGVIPLSYYYSRPVIATNIASLKENVIQGETGFIVEKNIDEIASLLKKILNNDFNLDEMSKNAFKYGNQQLSMESMAKDCIDIYFIEG